MSSPQDGFFLPDSVVIAVTVPAVVRIAVVTVVAAVFEILFFF